MLFFFALSCLAAATFGSVVLYQRGERRRLEAGGVADPRLLLPDPKPKAASSSPPARAPDVEPTLETLQLGDIVDDGEHDYVVVGTVRLREERETWAMHTLEGGDRQRFLEVRRRGAVDVAFVDVAHGLPAGQLFEGLTFGGRAYQLEVRGDARISVDGDVGGRKPGVVAYARYAGAGGALLLVEDEGTARRAFVGEKVPASSLSLMSGELNRQG